MPAESKKQRTAAGIAYAAKCKGEDVSLRGASKQMAEMSCDSLRDYAKTKEKGLPEKKSDYEQGFTDRLAAAGIKLAEGDTPCPGSKIRSKGQGLGLGRGMGRGPIGVPVGDKTTIGVPVGDKTMNGVPDGKTLLNKLKSAQSKKEKPEEKEVNLPCPGSKIRSKGKGLGLGRGMGKGPIGIPIGEKEEKEKDDKKDEKKSAYAQGYADALKKAAEAGIVKEAILQKLLAMLGKAAPVAGRAAKTVTPAVKTVATKMSPGAQQIVDFYKAMIAKNPAMQKTLAGDANRLLARYGRAFPKSGEATRIYLEGVLEKCAAAGMDRGSSMKRIVIPLLLALLAGGGGYAAARGVSGVKQDLSKLWGGAKDKLQQYKLQKPWKEVTRFRSPVQVPWETKRVPQSPVKRKGLLDMLG